MASRPLPVRRLRRVLFAALTVAGAALLAAFVAARGCVVQRVTLSEEPTSR